MNTIEITSNEKKLFIAYRDIFRTYTNGAKKNVDLQTLNELFGENVYRIYPESFADGVVVDMGAHLGSFSLQAASMGAKKVYAIEPNADNQEMLRTNIDQNNFESIIEIIPKAIWSDQTRLYMVDASRDSKVKSLFDLESDQSKTMLQDEDRSFKAETITLEQLIEAYAIQEIDVLKIDIEWSEYEIIKTWSDDLMAKIKYIAIEFHGTDKATFGEMISHLTRQFRLEILGSYERGGFVWGRRY